PVPNCGTTYFSIEFGGVNAKGIGDFSNGFAPTCAVADDLTREQGDPQEALLATALSYQQTGACPASNRSSAAAMAAFRTQVRPHVSQIAIHTKAR
ncbi:MAG: peptidase, partial [Massilia sp.]|nr:peptidase [Massilia sp.]